MAKKVARKGKKKLSKKYASFSRPHGHDRLRLDRPGRAAADLPAHRHQARADHRHLGRGPRRPEGAEEVRHHLHQEAPDPRELPPDARQARWARATSWSTCRSRSPRRRWSSSARRGARSTSTPASSRGRAATPTPACRSSLRSNYALRESMLKLAPQVPRRPDRGDRPRRQPRPGLALRQEGAGRPRPGHRPGRVEADRPARAGRGWRATSASR